MGATASFGSAPRIQDVCITEHEFIASLADGRVISVPLAWSWRLSEATPEQRANCRIIGGGQGVHWPDVDEDISAEGMLHGTPSRRPGSGRSRSGAGVVREKKRPGTHRRATRKKRTRG